MILARVKFWLVEYKIVAFMIFVFFGWLIIWLGWMLFIAITSPH